MKKVYLRKIAVYGVFLILRDIAKKIVKTTNIEEFLKIAENKYYEEVMIQG